MESSLSPTSKNPIALLRRFARPSSSRERCHLCAQPLDDEHSHLLELANHQLHCACDSCALLFSDPQSSKYRRVPRDIERWSDFKMTDEQWTALGIPIALAFFYFDSRQNMTTALYPSPAGATAADVPPDAWEFLCHEEPRLRTLQPDVEAILVDRLCNPHLYIRAPIDVCFKLVGLIRLHWRSLSGGPQVWREVDQFFQDLCIRAGGGASNA